MLFRVLATLAFAVSFDMVLFDGKHTHAVEQVGRSVPHFVAG
jgi:hypothetical protein